MMQDTQSTAETPVTSKSKSRSQMRPELMPTDDHLVSEGATRSESTLTLNCSCPCCTKPKSSHQPLEVSDPKVAIAHHSKGQKPGQE